MNRETRILVAAAVAAVSAGWFAWRASAGSAPAAPPNKKEEAKVSDSAHCKRLTPEEERVIVGKGTEMAFSGAFWDQHDSGMYRCKRCSAALFPSTAKFDSGTGWPSFDDAVPGAVKEITDADGYRTEIVCAACGAHLGHVFRGEGFTKKGVRHCVNSISLEFEREGSPAASTPTTGKDAAR